MMANLKLVGTQNRSEYIFWQKIKDIKVLTLPNLLPSQAFPWSRGRGRTSTGNGNCLEDRMLRLSNCGHKTLKGFDPVGFANYQIKITICRVTKHA
jgi:hypothetical protein